MASRSPGLEHGIGVAAFEPFLTGGAYDVIMPDVKYLGTLAAFSALDRLAAVHGARIAPHNPSGPVCHAASLHVAALCATLDRLEMQFDESPLFESLVGGPVAEIAGGTSALPPGSGLGVTLDDRALDRHRLAGLRADIRRGSVEVIASDRSNCRPGVPTDA